MEDKLEFEATVHGVNYHNGKLDDNSWIDISIRVQGEAGMMAAMRLNRAKNKIVTVSFEQNN